MFICLMSICHHVYFSVSLATCNSFICPTRNSQLATCCLFIQLAKCNSQLVVYLFNSQNATRNLLFICSTRKMQLATCCLFVQLVVYLLICSTRNSQLVVLVQITRHSLFICPTRNSQLATRNLLFTKSR